MKSYVLTLVSSEGEVTMSSVKNNLREAEDSLFATSADTELLLAAQNGDGDAFGRLVDPHQRELRAHCYRMLGSYADAEDALQETLLRAWRSLARFEGRSSLRSWLYRIATNACLRAIERRPKRVLPMDYAPAAGPHARYDQREGIELAFIAALQHLPARQRAVLILRDVLGFSARETAAVLETTPVSIDSALQRAHKSVDERLPSQAQQQTLRLLGDDELGRLIERYVAAWERNDIDALVSMLAQDARIAMPPRPTWYSGREQVAAFVRRYLMTERTRWRLVPASANGQPAAAAYLWVEQAGAFMPEGLHVLTLRGGEIEELMAFRSPEVFPSFGLPASIAA